MASEVGPQSLYFPKLQQHMIVFSLLEGRKDLLISIFYETSVSVTLPGCLSARNGRNCLPSIAANSNFNFEMIFLKL